MKGFIIATIGTPQNATKPAVELYLKNFLGDKHVISAPQPFRKRLVERIIIPNHISESMQRYEQLQNMFDGKMPLRMYCQMLEQKLNEQYTNSAFSVLQLHESSDSVTKAIASLSARGHFDEIVLVPLYPHRTLSSYDSVVDYTLGPLRQTFPQALISLVKPYFSNTQYIELLQQRMALLVAQHNYDAILYSYHSIPHVHQSYGVLKGYDYRKQCTQTANILAQQYPFIPRHEVAFQSAMGRKWLTPSTERFVFDLLRKGIKQLLVVTPGFLTDCLETVLDIGITLRNEFIEAGGERLDVTPALNADDDTVRFIYELANSPQAIKYV